jgi:hypothetical protein
MTVICSGAEYTDRSALSERLAWIDDAGSGRPMPLRSKSSLDLFNDFTYFLSNPNLGDRFH